MTTMNKPEKYSHERYREILRQTQDNTGRYAFCHRCQRYMPMEQSDDPCVFCGHTQWDSANPLKREIVNTRVLRQYMFETFKGSVEPFTAFGKRKWKNGHFFYRKAPTAEGQRQFCNAELWCVSHHGMNGYFLSMCARWSNRFVCRDGSMEELSFLNFLTFESPALCPDTNTDKDDAFYFDRIFETMVARRHMFHEISFKASNANGQERTVDAHVEICCEDMSLYENALSGSIGYDHLLKLSFTCLMTALDDFTLIPRYWGYKE